MIPQVQLEGHHGRDICKYRFIYIYTEWINIDTYIGTVHLFVYKSIYTNLFVGIGDDRCG